MSTVIFPLTIKGITRELKFNWGVARRMGSEAFSLRFDYSDIVIMYNKAHRIIKAALENNNINLSDDQVHEWMEEINQNQITEVFARYAALITDKNQVPAKEGEVSNTQ